MTSQYEEYENKVTRQYYWDGLITGFVIGMFAGAMLLLVYLSQ